MSEIEPTAEELLLPWYVSGRLTPEERDQVDRALAVSPVLRKALDAEQRLQAAVATAPTPPPPAIDPESLLGGVAAQATGAARWLKPALAAAVVGLLIQTAAIVWLLQPPTYRTAAGPSPVAEADSGRFAVHFLEDTTVGRIRTALDEAQAGIVRGPLPDGAFIVEVRNGEQSFGVLSRSGVARTITRTH